MIYVESRINVAYWYTKGFAPGPDEGCIPLR